MTAWIRSVTTGSAAALAVRLLKEESGQDLVEYGLILVFLAMALVATMKGLATTLGTFFGSLGATLTGSI